CQDCDLTLPSDPEHATISRHHFLLAIDPPNVTISDLGSLNGTYVNGEKIGQAGGEDALTDWPEHSLEDGDEIRIGNTIFRVGIFAEEPLEESLEPELCVDCC